MRIDINLASQPYQDSRRFWTYWGTGLVLLGLVTALLVFMAVTGFIRAGRDREQISKLQSQIAAYDKEESQANALLNQPQNRVLRDQSRFLNSLFEQKSFSWTKVFEDLERVMPAHLHVVSIRPDLSSDNNLELKLIVGGDSREQALDLVRKMEGSNRFKSTKINSEKTMESGGPGSTDRIQFEIEALYIPGNAPAQTSGGMY